MRPLRHHLAEDTIDRPDMDRLIRWLKTYPRLTKGKVTVAFETQWGRWLGRRHSVFCNSGSSANLLMFDALRLSGRLRNLKVVVPSVGWATSIAPAIQLGFQPLMCEADPDTFGLDLDHLERLLKRHRPSAVLLVQVLGVPHKMDAVMRLKRRYGFLLMEDACAAVGAEYHARKVGTFGDLSSFSYYFGHQFSTIEGGMVCTDDKRLADLVLMLRSHGWSKDLNRTTSRALVRKHHIDDFHSPFVFYIPGYNLRSTDLNAYIGLGQLKKLHRTVATRRKHHEHYRRRLADRFHVQRSDARSRSCSISFAMLARDVQERKAVVAALEKAGVETRIFSAGNLGLHPFWYERHGKASFPVADRIHHTGLLLPNHPSLSSVDVAGICDVVLSAVQ